MKNIKTIISLWLVCAMAISSSLAQDTKSEIGVSAGLLTAGEYYVEEADRFFEIRTGLMLHVFYDHYVGEKFSVGAFASLSRPELGFLEETANFVEVGLALKPRFSLNENITVKPGANLGYRMINSDSLDEDAGGSLQALGLDLTAEVQLHFFDGFTPYVDVGFITQPVGGNDEVTVTFGPVFNARFGVVFSL